MLIPIQSQILPSKISPCPETRAFAGAINRHRPPLPHVRPPGRDAQSWRSELSHHGRRLSQGHDRRDPLSGVPSDGSRASALGGGLDSGRVDRRRVGRKGAEAELGGAGKAPVRGCRLQVGKSRVLARHSLPRTTPITDAEIREGLARAGYRSWIYVQTWLTWQEASRQRPVGHWGDVHIVSQFQLQLRFARDFIHALRLRVVRSEIFTGRSSV